MVIYVPRRVGKTFLLEQLIAHDFFKKEKISFLKGDRKIVQDIFSSGNLNLMQDLIGKETTLFILNKAQKIKKIGNNSKLLIDEMP